MASEREQAKEKYLAVREQYTKAAKKASMSKLWVDIHYMLCGGVIIAAIIILFANWANMSASEHVWGIVIAIVAAVAFIAFGTVPTKKNLKDKKEVHDLEQELATLEDRWHL